MHKGRRGHSSQAACFLTDQQEASRSADPWGRGRDFMGSLRLGVLHQELTHEFLLFLVQACTREHALRDALPLARRELCRVARAE